MGGPGRRGADEPTTGSVWRGGRSDRSNRAGVVAHGDGGGPARRDPLPRPALPPGCGDAPGGVPRAPPPAVARPGCAGFGAGPPAGARGGCGETYRRPRRPRAQPSARGGHRRGQPGRGLWLPVRHWRGTAGSFRAPTSSPRRPRPPSHRRQRRHRRVLTATGGPGWAPAAEPSPDGVVLRRGHGSQRGSGSRLGARRPLVRRQPSPRLVATSPPREERPGVVVRRRRHAVGHRPPAPRARRDRCGGGPGVAGGTTPTGP